MVYLQLLISLMLTAAIFKIEGLNRVKDILYKIFWMDIIANENNFYNLKAQNYLKMISRIYFYPYPFFLIYMTLLSSLYVGIAAVTALFAVSYPLVYRMAMKPQLITHGKENILDKNKKTKKF